MATTENNKGLSVCPRGVNHLLSFAPPRLYSHSLSSSLFLVYYLYVLQNIIMLFLYTL